MSLVRCLEKHGKAFDFLELYKFCTDGYIDVILKCCWRDLGEKHKPGDKLQLLRFEGRIMRDVSIGV